MGLSSSSSDEESLRRIFYNQNNTNLQDFFSLILLYDKSHTYSYTDHKHLSLYLQPFSSFLNFAQIVKSGFIGFSL